MGFSGFDAIGIQRLTQDVVVADDQLNLDVTGIKKHRRFSPGGFDYRS